MNPSPLFQELLSFPPELSLAPHLSLNSPFRTDQLKEHFPPVQPNQLLRHGTPEVHMQEVSASP